MALTKQDLELIKQTLAPQFEKIDQRFEKIESRSRNAAIKRSKEMDDLKQSFKEDIKKLSAKFK